MTLSDYYHRDVPDYYDWMYLDGYTPYQILQAKHKQMVNDYLAREEAKKAQKEAEPEMYIPNITFKSVVKIIK